MTPQPQYWIMHHNASDRPTAIPHPPDAVLTRKMIEFDQAMKKFNAHFYYHKLSLVTACLIVFFQGISFLRLCHRMDEISLAASGLIFILAYVATDFVNGLIHMYMDNNTRYNSFAGPLIAAFHLHHKKPEYKKRNPFIVYFYESGGKFWLVPYLVIVLCLEWYHCLSVYADFFLVMTGILSSIAELSHYWCHNARADQFILSFLQKHRILLSKKHHAQHHTMDNRHYAFLNGVTDPLLNRIARSAYDGYKNNSDRHALAYIGQQTSNR